MIFLVEDDDAARDAISMLLECEMLPVRAFASCEALRQAADPSTADCLVLDVHMQGMTGLELLEAVHEHDPDLPVILMTGRLTSTIEDRAAAAGAFAVLEKPFNGKKLIETVTRALAA